MAGPTYKNSAIAQMAAQSCTIRIFAVECGIPNCDALFLSNRCEDWAIINYTGT